MCASECACSFHKVVEICPQDPTFLFWTLNALSVCVSVCDRFLGHCVPLVWPFGMCVGELVCVCVCVCVCVIEVTREMLTEVSRVVAVLV